MSEPRQNKGGVPSKCCFLMLFKLWNCDGEESDLNKISLIELDSQGRRTCLCITLASLTLGYHSLKVRFSDIFELGF
jgi:hypothetical protein